MSTDAEPLVLVRREGAITRITLNRPRAINALNFEMFRLLDAAVAAAQTDGSAAILLDGAGERGFCGGGDIKEISSGDAGLILAAEYRVDHAIAVSSVPVVALMDGIAMGGGIGLGGHAALRVVTERSRLAMPEVRIGIAPDVGGHLLLARAPGRLGELLAVTAGELGPGDAIACGIADAFVPADRLPELAAALAAGADPESAVAAVSGPAPDSPLLAERAWWEPIAERALGGDAPAAADPASAAARLLDGLERSGLERARDVAETVRGMCPVCVAVTLAQLDRTRREGLSLAEVLEDDHRVVTRLAARPDFAEGVRAQLVDKTRDPRWSPQTIAELDGAAARAELAAVLAPRGPGEAGLGLAPAVS